MKTIRFRTILEMIKGKHLATGQLLVSSRKREFGIVFRIYFFNTISPLKCISGNSSRDARRLSSIVKKLVTANWNV